METALFADGPRRTPPGYPKLVTTRVLRNGDHMVTIHPGADVRDVITALDAIPADAVCIEHFGDVDVVLLFRPVPPAGVTAALASPPAAPTIPAAR